MKNTLTVAAALLLFACGPSKEEIAKAHARNHMRAMTGIGCNDTSAYYAARSEIIGALKHPDASDIDSLHEVRVTRNGDTVELSISAMASNSFGVKDRVTLWADLYCRDDSLYWLGAVGTDGLGSNIEPGKPVEQGAQIAWSKARRERRRASMDAWMDSLSRGLDPKVMPE